MIKEAYCSFEVAKLLKEKGFDGECETSYYISNKGCENAVSVGDFTKVSPWREALIAAPTHQMAMKWLREEYNIFIQISAVLQDQPFGLHYRPSIQDYHAYARHDNFSEYVTYEEAVEVVLKYCLKNLI